MIHIVGTNHELQHTAKPSRGSAEAVNKGRSDLKTYLRELATEISAAIIAEEFCQDVLDIKNASSNIKAVADELGIAHRFCDPGFQERARLGLPPHGTEDCDSSDRRRYDAIREAYWVERLSEVLDHTVLFVCGADHVVEFSRLLRENGIAVEVREAYFGKDIFCR